jgi:hypothetical protein
LFSLLVPPDRLLKLRGSATVTVGGRLRKKLYDGNTILDILLHYLSFTCCVTKSHDQWIQIVESILVARVPISRLIVISHRSGRLFEASR